MKRVLDNVHVIPALSIMLKQGVSLIVSSLPCLQVCCQHPDLPIKAPEDICTRWDWSKVKVHLVPSIAGKHEGWPNVIQTGHTRLMKAVRGMGLATGKGRNEKNLELEYQVCTMGYHR